MFFLAFKQLIGCRHLLSDKHNGVEIQAGFDAAQSRYELSEGLSVSRRRRS